MAKTYTRELIHSWAFADTAKTTEERLVDMVAGVKAILGYNASLRSTGLYLSYGDKDFMRAYAFIPGVVERSLEIEVDVAEFAGGWDGDQNGRFIMMDESTSHFDEGLVYNAATSKWAFHDSINGWDDGFPSLEKTSFHNKTVRLRIDVEGRISLYVADEFIGTSKNRYQEKNKNLILGSNASAATETVVSALRIYRLNEEEAFTVRFLNKDKTDILSEQIVKKGEDAIAPVPEKIEGFCFIGWSSSFTNVQEDITVFSRYHEIPVHPVLNFYRSNSDNSQGNFIKAYHMVNSCSIESKLDGECTIEFTLLTRQTEGIINVGDRLEVNGLIFHLTELQKNISSGMCYTKMQGEHVSFILNQDRYKVRAFDMTGKPADILRVLLQGTPFTVGVVESMQTVTLKVNRECTRRAVVMQLLALVKGEIEYEGYTIGIREHVGKMEPTDIMKSSNVSNISYSYNENENRHSYTISLYQKGKVELGDELTISFKQLGIQTQKRVVGMNWNPFNFRDVSITVGSYIPTINDSLYQISSTVEDIREGTAKYTIEFAEIIGNGTFYFTRSYNDRPYFQVQTDDGSKPTITLIRSGGSQFDAYVGARLSGVGTGTVSMIVFYCTMPIDD